MGTWENTKGEVWIRGHRRCGFPCAMKDEELPNYLHPTYRMLPSTVVPDVRERGSSTRQRAESRSSIRNR